MPNVLELDILSPTGLDLIAQIDGLVDARLVADNGSTALFTMDASGTDFTLDYETIGGVTNVTGFSFSEGGETTVSGTFTQPQPTSLDYLVITMTNFMEDVLSDTRFEVQGSNGDDNAEGAGFDDRFQLAGGNDTAHGGQGNDIFLGGRGMDFLAGGADNDMIGGGKDSDLLIFGTGNDRGRGGDANDVIVSDAGNNTSWGGNGTDLLVLGQGSQTRHMDALNGNDVLLFTGFNLGDHVELGANAETLADVANGTVDDFQWRETQSGLEIVAGNALLQIAGASAKDIDLDRLYFSDASADEFVSGLLDASGPPVSSLNYEEITWSFSDNGSRATLADGTTVDFGTW